MYLSLLMFIVFSIFLLYFGRSLFIPLSVALLISFILYPLCTWFEKKKIPKLAAIVFSVFIFLVIIVSLVVLLVYQFAQFMEEWPELRVKLDAQIKEWEIAIGNSFFQIFIEDKTLGDVLVTIVNEYLMPMIPMTLYRSSVSFVLLLLIPVYVTLILFYRGVLVEFLYEVFPKSSARHIRIILPDVIVTYYNFIKGMGLVYLTVGILNSIGLALLGIPNPIFFGFIASILTFIPYIGITIGALLPMAISWLAYDSVLYPIGVIVVFVIVQILEANVIFPLAVSYRLNINALMTLVVIIAGGIIWGAMGMVLFLPFAAILKLVADQVEDWRAISILLGTREDIEKVRH